MVRLEEAIIGVLDSDLDGLVCNGLVSHQSDLVNMVCLCQSSGQSGQLSRFEMVTMVTTVSTILLAVARYSVTVALKYLVASRSQLCGRVPRVHTVF